MHTAVTGITTKTNHHPIQQERHSEVAKNSVYNVTDEVSIGILTPEKTQALLNRQIADQLEQRFKEEGIDLSGLQPADFTPEKVSERILGFVSGRILSEHDPEKQSELMAQAREGIEQGFAEARDILESLDVLNGKVKGDVDSTYDLIQQGLDRLEQQVKSIEESPLDKKNDVLEGAGVEEALRQSRFSRIENSRIEITTRDGDQILIDLFTQQSAQSSQRFAQNEDTGSYSLSRSASASVGISYQVQGELDDDEQKAIDGLLNDVAKVSDLFFSGDVQEAFKAAQTMDFDSEELLQLSLNLDYKETRQVAINTYSTYQSQSAPAANDDKPSIAQAELQELGDFVRQMDQLFQNPFAMDKFAQPGNEISALFSSMNQLLHSNEMKNLAQDTSSLLDSMIEQLKQQHTGESE